jgi:hypothetical protein
LPDDAVGFRFEELSGILEQNAAPGQVASEGSFWK